MKTLEITNFGGPLTRKNTGDANSGLAKFTTSWGYDPYSKPGALTWLEQPASIITGSILMMAMKQRVESGLTTAYAIANGDNLYKLTVNSALGPNIDTASVIGSLGTDKYLGGGGMTFYGSTEKIFLGGDNAIQKVLFTGASRSVIGSAPDGATIVANVPRPFVNFIGKVYFGNGNNLGEIDSTETITSVGKLSPALPSGLTIVDLRISPDGNYMQIIASRANASNALGGLANSGDTATFSAVDSYVFYWNGTDTSFSAIDNYPGMVLSANLVNGSGSKTFGYDFNGTAIFDGTKKIISVPETFNPISNAVFSAGNVIGFAAPEYEQSSDRVKTAIYHYGQYDEEVSRGLYRLLRQRAQTKDDVVSVPAVVKTTNKMHSPSVYGFSKNLSGADKIYYSTLESPSITGGTSIATLWKFNSVPSGNASVVAGVYETQTQLFSKRIAVKEVRVYTEPLVGGNDFTVDLINSGGSVLGGGSQSFTVGTGTTAAAGDQLVRFTPAMIPTYALGLRITNASVTGVANWTALKAEIDYEDAGY